MPKAKAISERNDCIHFKLSELIYLEEPSIPFLEKNSNLGNKLFSNYNEIEYVQKNSGKFFLKNCYFNKESIHDILYESKETIKINIKTITELKDFFYLDLLLKNEPNFLDYVFDKEGIIILCKILQNIKECPKKIIISKVIIDLIESYKGIGDYNSNITEQILDDIAKNCKKEIKKQIKFKQTLFSGFKYIDIIEKSIDTIYMELIIKLIKNDSVSFEDVEKVLNVLELKNINITEKMYQMFINFINSDENTLKKYYIEKFEDLVNIKKININYIILNYILKSPMFIYNIPFLLTTRNVIKEIIKTNLYALIAITADLDQSVKNRLEYIIKFTVDSDYYTDKYNLMKNATKEIISNKKLIYSFPLIKILIDNDINNIKGKQIESILNEWEKLNTLIKEKKYKKIKRGKINKLLNFFKDEKNKTLLVKLYDEKLYEFYHDLDLKNETIENNDLENSEIKCAQISNSQVLAKESTFQRIDDSSSMIIQSYTIKDASEVQDAKLNSTFIGPHINEYDLNLFKISDKYKVIEFYKLLEKNNCRDSYYQILKVVSKGHYITGLNNTKILLYNSNFQKKLEIYLFERFINVYEEEDKTNEADEEIHLIACLLNRIVLIKINIQKYTYTHHTIFEGRFNLLFQEKNKYILSQKGKEDICKRNVSRFNRQGKNNFYLIDNYKGGVKINNNLYALTSYDLYSEDKNKLVIFDLSKNRTLKEINNYSIDYTSVDPYILYKNNDKENIKEEKKVLICTCKKEKKNGFLILNMNLVKGKEYFSEYFYETKEFEPHCYCQLLNIENNNSISDDITNENNIHITKSDYFLVGGFDPEKRMGIVKLFKMIYDKENNVKVKYLFDLDMKDDENNFKGFDMKVISMQQSKITGNLLVSCLDGSVSLFKPPNFELLF